jgi:hypothetical protein
LQSVGETIWLVNLVGRSPPPPFFMMMMMKNLRPPVPG